MSLGPHAEVSVCYVFPFVLLFLGRARFFCLQPENSGLWGRLLSSFKDLAVKFLAVTFERK